MARPTYTIERTDRGYELHVNGDFYGWFLSHAGADKFRRLVMSGKPLDARTLSLIAAARAEKADRDNRAAAKQITENVSATVDA
jgi:hypothetical protein